ncbi:MAG: AAA family ATPase, partial [Candidatus Subteraquimicrobiales bacterium]|nr:AAA family ATPase [Candidatus Subteraquimicrobiales bacterium]
MTNNKNNKILYPRGSEWRKWDLHVHSPLSGLNNQYPKNSDGSPDWEQFINRLEEIKDVSVIGITDYFFIDGYKKIIEFKEQGKFKNFDLILPNVELRLDTLVVKEKSKDINFHVIFNNELTIDDIEKEFIEALDIQVSGSVSGLNGVRKLNRRTICEVGKFIKEHNQVFRNDSEEAAAFKNLTVSLKQVQELLRKDLFKGKFLFILSGHEWDDIDWKQAYLTKKNFLQTAHILETGSIDTVRWALGKKDLSKENFIKEFGRLKPCIHGSDAHHLDKICKPKDDKFCWIKADPTFEGLKQIIYEPEERVYIGKLPPKGKNDAKVIDRIEIRNSNNWFEDEPILLNDNLVSIIGEKGAGKTALADFIALTGGDFDIKEEDPGSFIFKALKSSKQIEETIENCAITIYWRDGSSDPMTITEDFKDYRDLKKVRYLSQSFIERKCSPEQAGELQKEVENIIFQYIPSQDRMEQTTFIDLKKMKTQSIQLKKSKCKKEIANLNSEIFNIEEEINSLDVKKEEKRNLQAEIEQLGKQKPKPTTEEEKSIEAKLGLLNSRKNHLNGQ